MNKPVLGILGAGKLGTVLAQLALKAGYTVYIAGSGEVSKIALTVQVITPGAIATTSLDAIAKASIIILALPLSKYQSIPPISNKLVIDAMNYWWEVDGTMPELQAVNSSSEMLQQHLPDAQIIKALSHMGYHNLLDDSRPNGAANRKAIAMTGNNEFVSELIDNLGFDPVGIGDLSAGRQLEPGNPLFGASVTAAEIQKLIS